MLFEFFSLSFQIKGRAQNFLATEPAEKGEICLQGEVPPDPPRRRRDRGRPRATVAPEVEQEPRVEHEVPVEGQAAFAAGMA